MVSVFPPKAETLKPETLYLFTRLLKSAQRSNVYIPIDSPDEFG